MDDSSTKRTSFAAGFPDDTFQLQIQVPRDVSTRDEAMSLRITVSRSETVDDVKRAVQFAIYSRTNAYPKASCFQLQQGGRHVPYSQSVTAFDPQMPVVFHRTAPEPQSRSLALATNRDH